MNVEVNENLEILAFREHNTVWTANVNGLCVICGGNGKWMMDNIFLPNNLLACPTCTKRLTEGTFPTGERSEP